MKLLSEALKLDDVILPQAIAGATSSAVYSDMSEYRSAILIVTATLGGGESVVIQAIEATDAAGTSPANLGATITLDDTANSISYIEVDTSAMTAGSEFLGVTLTPSGTSEVSVVLVRGKARYEAVTQVVDSSLVID